MTSFRYKAIRIFQHSTLDGSRMANAKVENHPALANPAFGARTDINVERLVKQIMRSDVAF